VNSAPVYYFENHYVSEISQTFLQVMENGEITQEGTYQELLQSGTAFEQLVNAHKNSKTPLDSQEHGKEAKKPGTFQYQIPMIPQNSEAEISTSNRQSS